MTVKSKTQIVNSINSDLADNNAGLISAADVRTNMVDAVESINGIVASGDHDVVYPFYENVRASIANGNGFFIAESGIQFPNASPSTQLEAYPGAGGIDHDDLKNRSSNADAHTQYLNVDGSRPMEENLPMGAHWINSNGAGADDEGIQFVGDNINIGTDGQFVYNEGSKINSGRAVAKAWINFDGSGTGTFQTPVVNGAYGVDSIEYLEPGKYKITMESGVLNSVNFAAIGNSNARTAASAAEDFDRNTVGLVEREYSASKASVTFVVLNEQSEYVDAEINDLVIFGFNEDETGTGSTVTII